MTMSAVVTMYLFGLVYFAMFGTYYFVDAYIPVAVFLGMHLLFTDPSTSPRTELGRVVFGATYALSVIALYGILGALGAPTFYDKLLAVPVMNLLVRGIDRHVSTVVHWRPGLETLFLRPLGRHRHLVHVGVWAMVFVGISAAQGIGDTHRGQWVSFWQQACADARPNGAAGSSGCWCRRTVSVGRGGPATSTVSWCNRRFVPSWLPRCSGAPATWASRPSAPTGGSGK